MTKEIDVIILILDYAVETVKGRAGSGAGSRGEALHLSSPKLASPQISFLIFILIHRFAPRSLLVRSSSPPWLATEEVQVVNLICGHNAPLGRAEMQELKYFIGKWESGEGSVGGGGGASATLV